jgi:ribosomal protein S18 acetylase RimI-like enzyme
VIAPPVVTLGRDGGLLDCVVVPWDSRIFGFPVAEIRAFRLADGQNPATALAPFEAWAADEGIRLASCRLDHDRLRESMALEDGGFRFVEMVHGPRFDLSRTIAEPRTRIDVTDAGDADLERLEAIAFDAFTTGRFLLDWRLPAELSRRRYATWVRTSLETPGQRVLTARVGDDTIGFFITEDRPDGGVYWHLTAVADEFQGRGLGLSLWQTMLRRHRDAGATSVETTISAHNTAALSLYARLGFGFMPARMTFHRIIGSLPGPAAGEQAGAGVDEP